MDLIDRIAGHTETAASALFGGAIGFAACGALSVALPLALAPAVGFGAVVAGLAFIACRAAMVAFAQIDPGFRVPAFPVAEFDRFEPGELLLTDADRLDPPGATAAQEPLELEDALPELAEDSRVVHLFDRHAMPAPNRAAPPAPGLGQQRLGKQRVYAAEMPDASQALSDALSELRRSIA